MSVPYNGADNGVGYGLRGFSNSNFGILGICNNPNLGSIWGDSQINVGAGVVGNSINGYALWGQSTTDATRLEGGQPYANVGVIGIADAGNGILGFAGVGSAVAGVATDARGFAGFFNGNVRVTGTIFKGSSNFEIDHPLDPKNKYLRHAGVESDEMKNLYDGVVTLNRRGEAVVRVPRWFESLNKDFRYQLTPIGGPAPNLHVSKPLRRGAFAIAGGSAGLTVSWQVTGIRQDRWAKANPLVVETPKASEDRGKYVHPRAHGKRERDGIGWIEPVKARRARRVKQG
jgi:hypothetical protein